ncbi:hypothetical protein Tco_1106756 [Tanacetum coccineum]
MVTMNGWILEDDDKRRREERRGSRGWLLPTLMIMSRRDDAATGWYLTREECCAHWKIKFESYVKGDREENTKLEDAVSVYPRDFDACHGTTIIETVVLLEVASGPLHPFRHYVEKTPMWAPTTQ